MPGIDRLFVPFGPAAMAIALDTLAYVRRLREAGFSAAQAEGQAEALAAAMTDTLATKQDLSELETRIGARFAATKHDFSELEARMNACFAAAKQDVRELEIRMDAKFAQVDTRLTEFERRVDIRFGEQAARLDGRLADLERRVTVRMLAGIAAVSALAKLL